MDTGDPWTSGARGASPLILEYDQAVRAQRVQGESGIMKSVRSYLVFDFETSGLEPSSDRIIQVGLCRVLDGRVTDRRGWLVNPGIRVPREATAIHGITTGDIKARGIPARESLTHLLEAMKRAPTCIGHNIHRFDVPFLLAESRRLGLSPPACADFVDTAALFKGWKLGMPRRSDENFETYARRVLGIRAPGLKYSVPTCLRELRIQADGSRLHEAATDAYLTHLIFEALQRVPSACRKIVSCPASVEAVAGEGRSTFPTPVDRVSDRGPPVGELK